MRRALLLGALLALPALAAERRIGQVVATAPTAQNNSTTAAPFTVPGNARISIQCSADAYVVISDSPTKLATNVEVKIAADVLFPTSTPGGLNGYVSVLPASGSATCQVYIRSGNEV